MSADAWKTDGQYEDHVLTDVRREAKHYVLDAGGWCLGIDDPGWEPQPGDRARYFGRGIGYPVRGVVIFPKAGGMPLVSHYRTEAEEEARHRAWCDDLKAKRYADLAAERDSRDARWAALPEPFQERKAKFIAAKGDEWRAEYEPYELFVCEQAVVIAEGLRARGEYDVNAFHKLGWEQQKLVIPALDGGHSGNTFGMACRLANWWLNHPENVAKDHGALVPLVGCEDYGCTHEPKADTGRGAGE